MKVYSGVGNSTHNSLQTSIRNKEKLRRVNNRFVINGRRSAFINVPTHGECYNKEGVQHNLLLETSDKMLYQERTRLSLADFLLTKKVKKVTGNSCRGSTE